MSIALYHKEVAEKFNRHQRAKIKEDFDTLLAMFSDPEENFSSIARKLGTSRQNIQQIYRQWFERFIPHKGQRIQKPIEISPLIKSVMKRIHLMRSRGQISKDIKIVLHQKGKKRIYAEDLLHVDNARTGQAVLCRILDSSRRLRRGTTGNRYIRLQVSYQRIVDVDFLIIVDLFRGSRRFFVIPAETALSLSKNKLEIYFYIPEDHNPKSQRTQLLTPYLEAWELLEKED